MPDENENTLLEPEHASPGDITMPDMPAVHAPPDGKSGWEGSMPAVWPPPQQTYRRRETLSTQMIMLIAIIAVALIASGLGFILYATSVQYRSTLHTQATAYAQATLQVQETAQAQAQATANAFATANANIYASATANAAATAASTAQVAGTMATATAFGDIFSQITAGTADLNDPLSDNTQHNGWNETNGTTSSACVFLNGDYHAIENQQGFLQPCLAETTNFSNFAYQVQMTIDKGAQGGIVFRANGSSHAFYLFYVTTAGSYALDLYQGSSQETTLASGFSPAISTGLGQSNMLGVIAFQHTIYLFANQQFLSAVTDNTLASGAIGVAALDTGAPDEAEFSNAQVWNISGLPTPTAGAG